MTIDQQLQSLSSSFAAAKRQPWFIDQFGGADGRQGRITEFIQRVCLATCASYCLKTFPNSGLTELGSAEGSSTIVLAEIAKSFGSAVLSVDPYIPFVQEASEEMYQQFLNATAPYPETIYHLRDKSQSPNAIQAIIDFNPSFVFLDGLHLEDAAFRDAKTCYEALPVGGLVCVDDTNMMTKDAGAAFQRAINEKMFRRIEIDPEVEKILYSYKSWHYGVKL